MLKDSWKTKILLLYKALKNKWELAEELKSASGIMGIPLSYDAKSIFFIFSVLWSSNLLRPNLISTLNTFKKNKVWKISLYSSMFFLMFFSLLLNPWLGWASESSVYAPGSLFHVPASCSVFLSTLLVICSTSSLFHAPVSCSVLSSTLLLKWQNFNYHLHILYNMSILNFKS